jgi:hypothetical protein
VLGAEEDWNTDNGFIWGMPPYFYYAPKTNLELYGDVNKIWGSEPLRLVI